MKRWIFLLYFTIATMIGVVLSARSLQDQLRLTKFKEFKISVLTRSLNISFETIDYHVRNMFESGQVYDFDSFISYINRELRVVTEYAKLWFQSSREFKRIYSDMNLLYDRRIVNSQEVAFKIREAHSWILFRSNRYDEDFLEWITLVIELRAAGHISDPIIINLITCIAPCDFFRTDTGAAQWVVFSDEELIGARMLAVIITDQCVKCFKQILGTN